jgi:iron complex outermembrane receptor protein
MQKFLFVQILLLLIFLCAAARTNAEDAWHTGELVVSATRWETPGIPTAGSIQVITREQITLNGARNLSDVLRGQGGLQIQDLFGDGSRTTVDMRGFGLKGGFNTLILVDGRRLNNTDLSTPQLNNIFLKDVERIEITRGAGTVLYGDQAVGGVINIITRVPEDFLANVTLGLASYDGQSQLVQAENRFDNGFGVRISAERIRSDGFRDNNDTDYINGFLDLSYDLDHGNILAEYQRTDEDIGVPGVLFRDEIEQSRKQSTRPADFNDSVSEMARLGGTYRLLPDWELAGEFTYRHQDIKGALTAFGATTTFDQKRIVRSINPRLRGQIPVGNNDMTVIIGADIEDTDYTLLSPLGVQDTHQGMQSVYTLLTVPVNRQLAVTAGLRKAWQQTELVDFFRFFPGDKLKDNQTASTLGISFRPTPDWRFFIKREDVYRFPLVDEETSVFGTPSTLETQTGTSYEAGGEWQGHGLSAAVTAYALDMDDEIIFNNATFENINLDPTERRGLLFEAGFEPVSGITLDARYTFTRAEFDRGAFSGNRVPMVAEHQLAVSADYRFHPHWNFHSEVFMISDRIAGNDFADTFPDLPGYGRVDVNLNYDNDTFFLNLGINNLLDKAYSDSASVGLNPLFINEVGFFTAPERNFFLTFGYTYR